jgi:multiple sugar transport system ATP-binding protein
MNGGPARVEGGPDAVREVREVREAQELQAAQEVQEVQALRGTRRPPSSVGLEDVSKQYDGATAVDRLTLGAAPGEFVVLLGPSGCGKTTVLRLVAGLEKPSSGVIRIGDRIVNDVDPKDRDVAMVFQSYALYPHMSVARNVEFPLRARSVPHDERRALVAQVAKSLRLTELLERKPAQLSGGQRQRVALARAIVRRPSVFLMDEPLSNLDAQLRVEMRAEIAELHATLGVTVLYVTHDQVEAMTIGERIAVMDRGRLQQFGSPDEVHDRPQNAFVAGFIGSPPMNIVRGRPTDDQGVMAVEVRGGRILLEGPESAAVRRSGLEAVLLGVRPEALTASREPPAPSDSGRGALKGVVSLVERAGHEEHIACRLEDGQLVWVRGRPGEASVRTGDALTLRLTGAVHLFEPDSGSRIDT